MEVRHIEMPAVLVLAWWTPYPLVSWSHFVGDVRTLHVLKIRETHFWRIHESKIPYFNINSFCFADILHRQFNLWRFSCGQWCGQRCLTNNDIWTIYASAIARTWFNHICVIAEKYREAQNHVSSDAPIESWPKMTLLPDSYGNREENGSYKERNNRDEEAHFISLL